MKLSMLPLVTGGLLIMTQCSKEDKINDLKGSSSTGDTKVNTVTGDWTVDQNHSTLEFESPYHGVTSNFHGSFREWRVNVQFDEKDLDNSSINAWVKLTSINTGEPGRDGLEEYSPGQRACAAEDLGVKHNGDTLSNGHLNPAGTDSVSNHATFSSKSIEKYGDGYRAKGDLTFNGVTKEVTLYFTWDGSTESETHSGKMLLGSFTGHFTFNSKSDFNVDVSSIGDKVTFRITLQVAKPA